MLSRLCLALMIMRATQCYRNRRESAWPLPELTIMPSGLPAESPEPVVYRSFRVSLLFQRLHNIRTIRHEPGQISIIPDHLLREGPARRRRAVRHVHDIVALVEGINQGAPDALVAINATEEEGRDARSL